MRSSSGRYEPRKGPKNAKPRWTCKASTILTRDAGLPKSRIVPVIPVISHRKNKTIETNIPSFILSPPQRRSIYLDLLSLLGSILISCDDLNVLSNLQHSKNFLYPTFEGLVVFSNWIWLASSSSLEVSLPEEVLKMIKKEAKRGRRVLIPVIKRV
ncbi:hypothetical protein [Pyrococcus kukulkanii]|uniref:Uncharacterized protein n=1 Tax=Pyrococcus kukulkanii TaxID=1609559 RepID=A0ABV4T3F6_9EURY